MATLLALDLGTTAAKAALFSDEGELLASASAPYATSHPQDDWAEQEPEDWWTAVVNACKRLRTTRPDAFPTVSAIGLSGHMNGCVLVEANGTPVRPALIHSDLRATSLCHDLARCVPGDRVFRITGHPMAPYFTGPKLAWLARNEAGQVSSARWCIQSKDWLAGRLTGRYGITDPSDASLTSLFDLDSGTWSREMCSLFGIPEGLLPEVLPSTVIVDGLAHDPAATLGLRAGIPVALGGGDGACTTAGAGAVEEGPGYVYLGGTAWIASLARRRETADRACMGRALQSDCYFRYGTVQSGGSALDWMAGLLGESPEGLERHARQAAMRPEDGPLFLPQLQGERVPYWDPDARGTLLGLRLAHSPSELARAAYEGVALSLRAAFRSLFMENTEPSSLRAAGGGARSRLLCETLAAALASPLLVLESPESVTSRGAAMCAAVAVGMATDWQDALRFVPKSEVVDPKPEDTERMALLAARHAQAYQSIRQWRAEGATARLR